MRTENINHQFLDPVVAGERTDVYYHLGVSTDDPILTRLRGVRAVVMAGSGERMRHFAERWSELSGDAEIVALPKEDRFVTRYTGDVLFCAHGMGMPSASIAVQELMRLTYFLKGGDLDALDDLFWARVGTSGGVGLPGGTVVLSEAGLMPDLQPYRLFQGGLGAYWFDGDFPADTRADILAANAGSGTPIVEGRTVATNEFFIEQFRLDGAIRLATEGNKEEFLHWLYGHGVRNIEMEGAMLAGYLNSWGFPSFAMICAVLLNRLEGDQVTSTPEELHGFSDAAGEVLFRYLEQRVLA